MRIHLGLLAGLSFLAFVMGCKSPSGGGAGAGGDESTGSGASTSSGASTGGSSSASTSGSGGASTSTSSASSSSGAGPDAGPTTFDWLQTIGTKGDNVSAMAADATGTVVAGQLLGSATINGKTYKATDTTAGNAFAVKLDTMGNPKWAVIDTANVGSSTFWSVAIAKNGDVLLGMHFDGSATLAGTQITAQNYGVALVALASDGSKVDWSQVVVAPTFTDFPSLLGIAVDSASGDIVTTGWLQGTAKFGTKSATFSASGGFYLASYSAAGAIQWAEAAPKSTTTDVSPAGAAPLLAVDSTGSIFVAVGAMNVVNGSPAPTGGKVLLNKYDATGAFKWSASGTGNGGTFFAVTGLTVDSGDSPIITGTVGSNGPTGPIAATFGSNMLSKTGFAVKYPSAGGAPTWATGIDNAGQGALYVAAAGSDVYVVGNTAIGNTPAGKSVGGVYTLSDSTGAISAGGPIVTGPGSVDVEAVASAGSDLYFGGTVLCPVTFGSLTTPASKSGDTVLFATRVNVP
jgi:hypothetical protein